MRIRFSWVKETVIHEGLHNQKILLCKLPCHNLINHIQGIQFGGNIGY